MVLIRAEKCEPEHTGKSWLEKMHFMNPNSDFGCENAEAGMGVKS